MSCRHRNRRSHQSTRILPSWILICAIKLPIRNSRASPTRSTPNPTRRNSRRHTNIIPTSIARNRRRSPISNTITTSNSQQVLSYRSKSNNMSRRHGYTRRCHSSSCSDIICRSRINLPEGYPLTRARSPTVNTIRRYRCRHAVIIPIVTRRTGCSVSNTVATYHSQQILMIVGKG